MVMNKPMQVKTIKRHLKSKGVDPDTIDVEAKVDSNLSMEENWKQIKKEVGISQGIKSKKEMQATLSDDVLRQAQMYHETRDPNAQELDENLVAKIPEDPDKWFEQPNQYDLPGIDFPEGKVKQKQEQKSQPNQKEKKLKSDKKVEDESDKSEERKPGDSFFGGRERTVKKLKEYPDLNPVKTIKGPEDFKAKLPYIPDIYEGGPRDVANRFDKNYGMLPEEAKKHYLKDDIVLKRLNAYRRAFNDWKGRAVRYYSIPSPVEAGPSKYPYQKLNKAQKSYSTGIENLDYRKNRLIQGLNGAVNRALKKSGTSVTEVREAEEDKQNKQIYDKINVGTIIESPLYGQATVVKKNKKSIIIETGGGELRIPYHMLRFLKVVGQKKESREEKEEEGVISGKLRRYKHKAEFQVTNYPVYGLKEEGREDVRLVFPSKSNNHVMFSAKPLGSQWKVHWEGRTYRATKKLYKKGIRRLPCLAWEIE